MQMLPAKAKVRKKEGIREDYEIKMGNILQMFGIKHPWNVSKLARTLCLVESINNRKIKTDKAVGAGCVWKGISLING